MFPLAPQRLMRRSLVLPIKLWHLYLHGFLSVGSMGLKVICGGIPQGLSDDRQWLAPCHGVHARRTHSVDLVLLSTRFSKMLCARRPIRLACKPLAGRPLRVSCVLGWHSNSAIPLGRLHLATAKLRRKGAKAEALGTADVVDVDSRSFGRVAPQVGTRWSGNSARIRSVELGVGR